MLELPPRRHARGGMPEEACQRRHAGIAVARHAAIAVAFRLHVQSQSVVLFSFTPTPPASPRLA